MELRLYMVCVMLRSVDVFDVVADPSRRRLLDLLDGGDRSVGELMGGLPALTQPAVSRHLRILRDAGLVESRTEGQRRIYTLRPKPLAELDGWIDRYRRYWPRHLDALERHLDERGP